MHISVPRGEDIDICVTIADLVLRACNTAVQLPSPRSRMEAYQKLDTALQNLRQQLFSTLNDAALINRLPDDLLMRIFCQLPHQDLLYVMFSCRRWCILGDETLGLPCQIQLYPHVSFRQFLPHLLALPENEPLSLDITVYHSFEELGAFLREQMHRIQKFRLRLFNCDEPVAEALFRPLVHAFQEAAPKLEAVDIYIAGSPWTRPAEAYLPDELFARSAPRLRFVKLDGIATRPLRAYDALSAVRVLDLCQPEVHLVRVLNVYPRLEELRVATESLVSGRRKINPHHLRLLELPGTVASADIILNRLVLTRPLLVWMDDVDDETVTYIILNAPRSKIRRVQFCLDQHKRHHCLILGYSTGVTWFLALQNISHAARGLILSQEDIMSNIVDLSIHEVQWLACDSISLAPLATRLTRLELVIDACAGDDVHFVLVHDNAALFYCGSGPFPLRCPALQEICLSAPARVGVLTVDVYDVCAFICCNLSFDSQPHLALRNVQLYDPALGRGMQMLTACVAEITYSHSWVHDVPYIHLDSNMLWMYDLPSL